MNKLSNKTKGIICILLSAFCFSGMSSFINLSGDLPVPQKVFFRNLVALFCASAVLLKNHQPFKPTKGCLKYHFLPFPVIAGDGGLRGELCSPRKQFR